VIEGSGVGKGDSGVEVGGKRGIWRASLVGDAAGVPVGGDDVGRAVAGAAGVSVGGAAVALGGGVSVAAGIAVLVGVGSGVLVEAGVGVSCGDWKSVREAVTIPGSAIKIVNKTTTPASGSRENRARNCRPDKKVNFIIPPEWKM